MCTSFLKNKESRLICGKHSSGLSIFFGLVQYEQPEKSAFLRVEVILLQRWRYLALGLLNRTYQNIPRIFTVTSPLFGI